MPLSHTSNIRLVRITKSIEYNAEEDEYLVTSFKTGGKYQVFRLNNIWVCSCKSFLYNKEGCQKGVNISEESKWLTILEELEI